MKTSKKHEAGVIIGRAMTLTYNFSIVMVSQAFSQENWTQRKCDLYSEGWRWVLQSQDLAGVRQTFIQGHQAFIDANCDHAIEICPVTKRERQTCRSSDRNVDERRNGKYFRSICLQS